MQQTWSELQKNLPMVKAQQLVTLADLVLGVSSTPRDQGVPPDEATAYASWAIGELLAATTREEPRP